MIKYMSVKFRFDIPYDCWETAKNLTGILFAAPCIWTPLFIKRQMNRQKFC